MSAQYQLNNGGFFYHFFVLALLGGLGFAWIVATFSGEITADANPVFSFVGAISMLAALLYPVLLVGDVSDKIPLVAEHNKNAKQNGKKKIKVRHPKTMLVWVLFVLGIFTFGLLWIVALIVAAGTHNVTITDDLAIEMGMKEVGRDGAGTNAQELLSLKELHTQGVITDDEFSRKKSELGF